MLSSIDGKIDGEFLGDVMPEGEYEATGARLKGDGWIRGRITMQQHFAEPKPFVSKSKKRARSHPVFVAAKRKATPFALIPPASWFRPAAIWMATI